MLRRELVVCLLSGGKNYSPSCPEYPPSPPQKNIALENRATVDEHYNIVVLKPEE